MVGSGASWRTWTRGQKGQAGPLVKPMKNVMIAGIALMMMAGALPATAYHMEHLENEATESGEATYVVGLTDLEVFCESYGLTDPVNSAPAAHGGTNGLCFMSSNDGNGCPPGTPSQTDPLPVDNCAFTVRPTGTFTTFNLVQTPLLPDVTASRTGNVFFTANPGGNSGGLFAGAGAPGACVQDNYSDVGGQSGGHVAAFDPLVVVFLGAVGSVPVVVLNSLPGDVGTYTHVAGACAASLSDNVSGLGVFYVNPVANSGLYIF